DASPPLPHRSGRQPTAPAPAWTPTHRPRTGGVASVCEELLRSGVDAEVEIGDQHGTARGERGVAGDADADGADAVEHAGGLSERVLAGAGLEDVLQQERVATAVAADALGDLDLAGGLPVPLHQEPRAHRARDLGL